MRLVGSMALVLATAVAACKSGEGQNNATKRVEATATGTSSAHADVSPVKEKPKPASWLGSTIARTPTSDALYVADEDRGQVLRVSMPIDVATPPKKIAMPGQPAQVLVLADKVLVTVRSEGAEVPASDKTAPTEAPASSASASPKSPPPEPKVKMPPSPSGPGLLLVMRPDADKGLAQIARIELPEDAWGVTVTPDESLAIVTSAWTHKVSVVDLAAGKVKATLDVAREPRAVVVHPSGKFAYVTHLVGTELTRIDGLGTDTIKATSIALPPAPSRSPSVHKITASLAYSATLSPDGKKLFVPRHALGARGPQVWLGVSTVDVLLTQDDSPLCPPLTDKPRTASPSMDALGLINDEQTGGDSPHVEPNPFVQPRAIVYRQKDDTLLIAGEGNDYLAAFYARTLEPAMFQARSYSLTLDKDPKFGVSNGCAAPSGIAMSQDENTAWVFCRASATLAIVTLDQDGPRPWVKLDDDPLAEQIAVGRKLFYNGTDEVTSGGMGCAGCHPEGRDDGHVWREAFLWDDDRRFFAGGENVPDWPGERHSVGFPRQTPMLAGRLIAEGPYGWRAESPHLTHRLTNGFRLHRWGPYPYG